MEAVRLKLRQASANYRREETVDNKMTYPLPPFSTVIGALHKACGYREYHPMDISIQGNYGALKKKVYTDHCFLNRTENDRGTLVKMVNPDMLSNAYVEVAQAKKSQGNDFYKGITIDVKHEAYLQEYRDLKDLKKQISDFRKTRISESFQPKLKKLRASLKARKAYYKEDKERLEQIKKREKELSALDKRVKQSLLEYEEQNYTIPYSHYRTLTKGPKYYEILTDVELVIHVRAEHQTLQDILDHIFDLKAIGRSEDAVEVLEAEMVDLKEPEEGIESKYHAYLSAKAVEKEWFIVPEKEGIPAMGTKYLLNKDYRIVDGKRQFSKKAVVYTSAYCVELEDDIENIYLDDAGDKYIVNFI
ncbi:CRISPR-associated protein Cas5 [Anaerovorax odorimutans]|uniref:CRISPR-associated protein Cas5 n=1 Tax=Anaerovorax odorimutans TaxID=109327 RepID=A0ABT1RLM6_9FIRM|nr:CRISPR-associated protein Cas5 [Anaerovorax odorimutans]MCQ4636091.1 CRISPR-associated protein Cas5 [Anaerovorax odorimutans]